MIFTPDITFSMLTILTFGFVMFFKKFQGIASIFLSTILMFLPILFQSIGDCSVNNFVFSFAVDRINILIYIVGILSGMILHFEQKKHGIYKYEANFLLVLLVFISSYLANIKSDMVIFYVATEVMSLISMIFILGVFKDQNLTKAGMKYIIFSSLSSIMLLVGVLMVYFSSGGVNFINSDNSLYNNGIIVFFIAILMKLGIFPFYIWLCDVYDVLKVSVLNIVNIIPKLGILFYIFSNHQYFTGNSYVSDILSVVLILSIVASAIRLVSEKSIKRLMVLSGSVNVSILLGFLILGFIDSSLHHFYYIVAYAFAGLLISVSLVKLFNDTGADIVEDGGNFIYNSFDYLMLICALLSLAGIPPFLGFIVKFLVLKEVILIPNDFSIAYVFSVILVSILSSYYYLKIPLRLYLNKINIAIIKSKMECFMQFISIFITFVLFAGYLCF